ncbi:MAG: DUF4389 domain-containing protein [Candidatus Binatia bacterium]
MPNDSYIDRKDTGIRILLSAIFLLIAEVTKTVLVLLTLFALGWTLITKRPPSEQVRRFANRVVSYQYHLFRYLTYNEKMRPFPFSDFPTELELPESTQG